jgi:hypothetical protein
MQNITNTPAVQVPTTLDATSASVAGYTFDLDCADIDSTQQAEAAQQPLTQMVLKSAGYPASCRDLPATMSALRQTYLHEVTEYPDLLSDHETMSGAALICARHALAHLAMPLADLTSEERADLIFDNFHTVRVAEEAQPFWDWLSDVLYFYTGPAYDQGWRSAPGVVPADVSMSMPAWRAPTGQYVCDLVTFRHPDEDTSEVDEAVTVALGHARMSLGCDVVGIRVIPLCGGPTRLHFADRTQAAVDMPWRECLSFDLP